MTLTVSRIDDFHRRVEPAYNALLYETEAPTTLEIALAPGEYRDWSLSLVDAEERGHVGVIVRAADPLHPPVLTNLNVKLTGHDVTLEGIVFKRSQSGTPLLYASVNERLSLHRCAFLGCAHDAYPAGAPLIELNPGFDARRDKTALIRDCWFIGNREYSPSALLALNGLPPYRFRSIRFENTVFLDNPISAGIVPGAAEQMDFSDCFVYTGLPQPGEAPRPFVVVSFLRTALTFEHGAAIGDDLDSLFTFSSSPPRPRSAYTLAAVRDTALYLRDPLPSGSAPKPIVFTDVETHPAGSPHMDVIAAALEKFTTRAEQGGTPDIGQRAKIDWISQLVSE